MKKLLSVKNVVISVAILILIWQLLFMVSSFDAALFPSPKMALDALIEMIQNGKLFENIKTSMFRFAAGYISSVAVAVVLGLILGRLPKVFQYINPAVQLLRPISPTAGMPFIVSLSFLLRHFFLFCFQLWGLWQTLTPFISKSQRTLA